MSGFANKMKKDCNVEQAFRRLKYLHTPLIQKISQQDGRLRNFCENETKDSIGDFQKNSAKSKPSSIQKCDFYLQPKNQHIKQPKSGDERELKSYKYGKNGLCQNRAPLVRTTAYFSLQYTPHIQNRTKTSNDVCCIDKRDSNSAPLPKISSPQQFTNKDTRKNPTKYTADIKTGRVCLSARPVFHGKTRSSKPFRQMRQFDDFWSKSPPPEQCYYGAWGIRKRRQTESKAKNLSLEPHTEIEAGLKTLLLGKTVTGSSYPPPPPTPIQQTDIKLPHVRVIMNRVS